MKAQIAIAMYVDTPQPTPRGYIQRSAAHFSPEARQMLFSFMIDSPEEITSDLQGAVGSRPNAEGVQDTAYPRTAGGKAVVLERNED